MLKEDIFFFNYMYPLRYLITLFQQSIFLIDIQYWYVAHVLFPFTLQRSLKQFVLTNNITIALWFCLNWGKVKQTSLLYTYHVQKATNSHIFVLLQHYMYHGCSFQIRLFKPTLISLISTFCWFCRVMIINCLFLFIVAHWTFRISGTPSQHGWSNC